MIENLQDEMRALGFDPTDDLTQARNDLEKAQIEAFHSGDTKRFERISTILSDLELEEKKREEEEAKKPVIDDFDYSSLKGNAKKKKTAVVMSIAQEADAAFYLEEGYKYHFGEGVPQDYKKAYELYLKAAEMENIDAISNLGLAFYNGDLGLQKDLVKAAGYLQKAAEKGKDTAQYDLAMMYFYGKGVAQDYGKYVFWIKKAVEQGNDEAEFDLAISYLTGEGTEVNLNEAVRLLKESASKQNSRAQENLGILYRDGRGVPQDYMKAAEMFVLAMNQGEIQARHSLGVLYFNGTGVPQNKEYAIELWKQNAELGCQESIDILKEVGAW